MKILHLCVGVVRTNCYIIFDEATKEGAVVDPGDSADAILEQIRKEGIALKYILLTHAHFDHILAVKAVKEATGAQLVLHEADAGMLKKETMSDFRPYITNYQEPTVDIYAKEGTQVAFGGMAATYLNTPGHTPGSSVIMIGDCLFTGDTLFRHECGRCDLPGGNFDQMLESLKRLHDLPGDFHVLPGHEDMSTLTEERSQNPYIRQALAR
ncbi:MAG: MBL fold metallo-hydrolase [Intestinibacillus sp.]